MPMMALVNPVYDCLFRLAQPDSLNKEEEVGDPFGQPWRWGAVSDACCPWRHPRASLRVGAWWGHARPASVPG